MPRRRKATTRKSTRKTTRRTRKSTSRAGALVLAARPRRAGTMRGRGTVGDILSYVKDNKLISRGLGMVPHAGVQTLGRLAGMVGLGRRRRSTRKSTTSHRLHGHGKKGMHGKGIFSDLGGGIGSVFGGLGGGIGSVAHGLFGGGAKGTLGRARRVIKI